MALVVPTCGGVNHPVRQKIQIRFSEWISTRNIERAATVFPPVPKGHRVRVNGKVLEITPVRAFAESTTYHIELTTGLQDLHGNAIGKPFALIFSTGSSLDSSSVSGCVVDPENRIQQPKVALYLAAAGSLPGDSLLAGTPSYLTQTDSFGRFSLENIKGGLYEGVAFTDANNDNRFQPGREESFAPATRQFYVTAHSDSVLFFPVTCDTATRRITGIRPVSSTLLMGEWNRSSATKADTLAETGLKIASADTAIPPPVISAYIRLYHSKKFAIRLSTPLERTGYRLLYHPVPVAHADTSAALMDTIRFNGVIQNDTIIPKLAFSSPASNSQLHPVIRCIWNKPVRLPAARFALHDTTGDTVYAIADTGAGDTTVFSLTRRLKPATAYRMLIPRDSITDLGGLHPSDTVRDSLGVTIKLTTIDADSLCISMSGSNTCAKPDPRARWIFLPFIGQGTYTSADSAGAFRFDSIPAGKGRLALLTDLNGDGAPTAGSLYPWKAPEPYVLLRDTVEARARWEIENVVVNGCATCQRPKAAQDSTGVDEKLENIPSGEKTK